MRTFLIRHARAFSIAVLLAMFDPSQAQTSSKPPSLADEYVPATAGKPAQYRMQMVFYLTENASAAERSALIAPFQTACMNLLMRLPENDRDWSELNKCKLTKMLERPKGGFEPLKKNHPKYPNATHAYTLPVERTDKFKALIEFQRQPVELSVEFVTLPFDDSLTTH